MEEELISIETARLAKEKGFNISTQKAYIGKSLFVNFEESFEEREFYFDADDFYNDWNRKNWFFDEKGNGCFGCKLDNIKWFEAYAAPTQSLLQKWLREKHSIYLTLTYYSKKSIKNWNDLIKDNYFIGITDERNLENPEYPFENYFDNYEDALEAGLFEALKLI